MLRKCACLFGAVCLIINLGLPAKAKMHGSIQVKPQWGGELISGGNVSIYRIGNKLETGCHITDGLANWVVSEEEIRAKDFWKEFQWNLQPEQTSPVLDITGAVFEDLQEGIYLVKQQEPPEGFAAFLPFLICIPEGVCWDIAEGPKMMRLTESPETGDHPAPIIGAMGLGFSVAVLMVLVDERKK